MYSCHITASNVPGHVIFFPTNISGKSVLLQGAVENLLERSVYIQLLDGSVVLLDEGAKALVLSTLREMSGSACIALFELCIQGRSGRICNI